MIWIVIFLLTLRVFFFFFFVFFKNCLFFFIFLEYLTSGWPYGDVFIVKISVTSLSTFQQSFIAWGVKHEVNNGHLRFPRHISDYFRVTVQRVSIKVHQSNGKKLKIHGLIFYHVCIYFLKVYLIIYTMVFIPSHLSTPVQR